MATIKVCDFPGCGDVIAEYPDRLRMSFAMLKFDAVFESRNQGSAALQEALASQDDPESLTKELCRNHALHVRAAIAELFA